MKYEIEATIPVVQYGNIKPKFTVENEQEEKDAIQRIKLLWKQYGETALPDNTGGGEEIVSFNGETLLYNDAEHTYYDLEGNKLLSGSKYADKVSPKFDADNASKNFATKYKVKQSDVLKMWSMSGDSANEYGTAIHNALEKYHLYHEPGSKISEAQESEENYALPKNGHMKRIVQNFVEKFGIDAQVEVLVSDVKNGRAGQVDRLVILDEKKKSCRIGDYKTNAEMNDKKLKKYQHQLSFYAHILIEHGWTVEGLDIYHLNEEDWEHHELEVLDLQEIK